MPRPRMPTGTHGEIAISQEKPSVYKARVYYRATDGKRYTMSRRGQTKAAARRALGEALAEWQRNGGAPPTPDTTVRKFADRWLESIDQSERSPRTKEHYRYAIDRYVTPTLGDLMVREASTRAVDEALQRVRFDNGPGAAKTARAVLNGVFSLAVRHDLLPTNPVRETSSINPTRKAAHALTDDEVDRLTDALRSDEQAALLDLPDLVEWMLGTGCRIGEALALRQSSVDLTAGTWEINATLIRVKAQGLRIQERPKTAAGWRVLALPPSMVEMVRRRETELRLARVQGVVFGSPKAKALRDPSNTASDLRDTLRRLGFPGVTSHTFRKTVATKLDGAGLSARQIADHLGHAQPSLTLDVYMGRQVVLKEAAAILDR